MGTKSKMDTWVRVAAGCLAQGKTRLEAENVLTAALGIRRSLARYAVGRVQGEWEKVKASPPPRPLRVPE